MTRDEFDTWLAAYGRAWEGRDAEAAAALFTENATYQVTPFEEPHRGREAVRGYWAGATSQQTDIHTSYQILAVTDDLGVVLWRTAMTTLATSAPVAFEGIFVVWLNEVGLCTAFREWWHVHEGQPG
jgi:hypothetical protein